MAQETQKFHTHSKDVRLPVQLQRAMAAEVGWVHGYIKNNST